jgi:hypothetical protein
LLNTIIFTKGPTSKLKHPEIPNMAKSPKNTSVLKLKSQTELKEAQISRQFLEELFQRNGYLRIRNPEKWKISGSNNYKKGFEIRFVAKNEKELQDIQASISSIGYKVCKPYLKGGHMVQPLYGKEITLQFQSLKKLNINTDGIV